ncbi:hypothetical protein IVB56_13360 [Bradyrhizobium sp. CW7]|uniref:hypothetical protein n=1 Tax=Bradyrhizobium sp. CW7 TaxID=2782688 RepID=UPI001FFA8F32|nr:hypothetical protein [Bradyrhizobium sp. CW7]MCK1352053.1 hypothetical protein [Bradyrhizobium sp. CW7]
MRKMQASRLFRGLLFIAAGAAAGPSWAQSPVCLGPMKEPHPHPYGSFNFETNSLYAETSKLPDVLDRGDYKYGIVSCVSNPDRSAAPLFVHWLIPGPVGWIQPGDILNSSARLTNDATTVQLEGCLEYGSRGDMTGAHFSGVISDKLRVEDEKRRGCRAVAALPQDAPSGLIKRILMKIRNRFPSDAKNPTKTMLSLEGTVGIDNTRADQYTSIVSYEIKQDGNEGVVEKIRIRPAFRGATEALLPAFNERNPKGIEVASKGRITFDVVNVTNPRLDYASYEIFDQNNQLVGAVAFPVFISSAK